MGKQLSPIQKHTILVLEKHGTFIFDHKYRNFGNSAFYTTITDKTAQSLVRRKLALGKYGTVNNKRRLVSISPIKKEFAVAA